MKNIGKHNFSFEILWRCEPKDCLYFEQLYLDYYEPWAEISKGYNICKNSGNRKGVKHTEETKKKLSKANFGKKASEKSKKKMSETRTGENNSNSKSVECIDPYTGEVKEYSCIIYAEKEGFEHSLICRCCRGKSKTHKGYYWQYL